MAFVTIEDPEGQAEVVMFSDVLEKARRFVVENNRGGGRGTRVTPRRR
jgi:DNA polymerase III alpha subunit